MTMSSGADVLISGGRIIDPSRGFDEVGNLWVRNGKVSEVTPPSPRPEGRRGLTIVDATNLIVCPGLVDLHSHLRDPGQEDKETIATGTGAAARGGFTTVCTMANTLPVVDNRAVVEYIQRSARVTGVVRVCPMATVTRGMAGRELTEMAELAEVGVIAFSDDGKPVTDSSVMRHALEYSRLVDRPIMVHEEDLALTAGGVMNEGPVATRLGLKGWPGAAEEIMIARDLILLKLTGGKLHLAHVTTAGGVDLIRRARDNGLIFTAETTPHHLTMTDDWVAGWRPGNPAGLPYDTSTKVNPPLRSESDRLALVEAIRDGTLDLIGTDHAPHPQVDKECEYGQAAFGITGFETALASLMGLVHSGDLELNLLIRRLTCEPARAFALPVGTLAQDAVADICIFDPNQEWIVDPREFASKGKNTPLAGQKLRGKVAVTLYGGSIVHLEPSARHRVAGEGMEL